MVHSGGTLDVAGSSTQPVTFTSIDDNTIGGATGSGSPVTGNYSTAIDLMSSSALRGTSLAIDYAETAINMQGGDAILSGLEVSSDASGFSVVAGNVSLRGTVVAPVHGVTACDWGSGACAVEATHVDWGTSAGPFLPAGDLVCVTVLVDPWIGQTDATPVFQVKNCAGSDTPGTELSDAADYLATSRQVVYEAERVILA